MSSTIPQSPLMQTPRRHGTKRRPPELATRAPRKQRVSAATDTVSSSSDGGAGDSSAESDDSEAVRVGSPARRAPSPTRVEQRVANTVHNVNKINHLIREVAVFASFSPAHAREVRRLWGSAVGTAVKDMTENDDPFVCPVCYDSADQPGGMSVAAFPGCGHAVCARCWDKMGSVALTNIARDNRGSVWGRRCVNRCSQHTAVAVRPHWLDPIPGSAFITALRARLAVAEMNKHQPVAAEEAAMLAHWDPADEADSE